MSARRSAANRPSGKNPAASSSGLKPSELARIKKLLGQRPIVLIGMMGAGKTSVGRRLASLLDWPFVDSDAEIESAAGMEIPDIFDQHGEDYFRSGETRVITRLLGNGPQVLATGGGAFMNMDTRKAIAEVGYSVFIKTDLDLLFERVSRRSNRPLLKTADPKGTLANLIADRYPTYEQANLTVTSRDVTQDIMAQDIAQRLLRALNRAKARQKRNAKKKQKMTNAKRITKDDQNNHVVHVGLGDRAYDIVIGSRLLDRAGQRIASQFSGARLGIVTDEHVASAQLDRLTASLEQANLAYSTHRLPAGEATKSMAHLETTVEALLDARLERGDLVVALGGGVVGDLAGFAASVTRRGMRFIQMPTSLLAQVDSSVGGKTGINSPHGKNLIGAFHQPSLVLADLDALNTLTDRQFAAGYAEVAKYGLIDDADFFFWLEDNLKSIFDGGPARAEAIARSCAAKARVVEADETEQGQRALLNLGHTFGHALEAATGYSDRLLHGEGVAIGMTLAHAYSARIGIAPGQDTSRVEAHLKAAGLPTKLSDIPGDLPNDDVLLNHIAQDKKVSRGQLNFILTRGIGKAFIQKNVEGSDIKSFLSEMRAS